MKLLRKIIRQIILEGAAKDSFNEKWFTDDRRGSRFSWEGYDSATHHKDSLNKVISRWGRKKKNDQVDIVFDEKRDLKRLWNETIDANNLRGFWEGPKMKYFHSLGYYGDPSYTHNNLEYEPDDDEMLNLSAHGFFQLYDKSGNKDEMSTFGIYDGKHMMSPTQTSFGVLMKGRVTLATGDDAFTESRSKALKSDMERHKGSGLPKRVIANDEMIRALLFEEEDIIKLGRVGECVLDNWSIEAIVCDQSRLDKYGLGGVVLGAKEIAKQYGVPLLEPKDLGTSV